jgi:UV excision repair protein RAD23
VSVRRVALFPFLTDRILSLFSPSMCVVHRSIVRAQAMQGSGGMGGGGGPQVLRLTEEEMAAVNRLADMGFDRTEAAQAYLACDKNEALAANLLMDGGFGSGFGFGDGPGNDDDGGSGTDGGNDGNDGGNDGDDMYD